MSYLRMFKLENTFRTLWNGQRMPLVGLGTSKQSLDDVRRAVNWALEAGYRLIDTAQQYENESVIGQVLQEWIESVRIKRQELFIISKLPHIGCSKPEKVEEYLKSSLSKLKLDYLDLYMIHTPFGMSGAADFKPAYDENGMIIWEPTDHIATWKTLEAQVDSGLVKSIGMCNFNSKQLAKIMTNSRIKPSALQVEVHAYFQQKELRRFCQSNGIAVCAYAPLGSGGRMDFYKIRGDRGPKPKIPLILEDSIVIEIAKARGRTPAQIVLRHLIQQDVVVIPKSGSQDRIKENFKIFDFQLTVEEMDRMNSLDRHFRIFDFISLYGPEINQHPEYPFRIKEEEFKNSNEQ